MNLSNTVNFEREIMKAEIVKVEHGNDDGNGNREENKNDLGGAVVDDRNEVYYFHFVGNSFLWHQIRFMSSVLFMVGQGT